MANFHVLLIFLLCFIGINRFQEADGHGMMIDPINRGSVWRVNASYPTNYNDNQNFCGGFYIQYYKNGGRCGLCGDNYADKRPRTNENTGKYGLGYIAATYKSGSTIKVTSLLTANHLGYFQYSLCQLEDPTKPEANEDCFKVLNYADGTDKYPITKDMKEVTTEIILPEGLTCDRCVLRWHYNCGNNWGVCENGQGGMGCGPQENFRGCADVKIIQ